eukprot:7133236-Pyramimonas_sp.AAC.1
MVATLRDLCLGNAQSRCTRPNRVALVACAVPLLWWHGHWAMQLFEAMVVPRRRGRLRASCERQEFVIPCFRAPCAYPEFPNSRLGRGSRPAR